MADDWLDGISSAQLTLDRRGLNTPSVADVDVSPALVAVPFVAAIDIGASDLDAGDPLDLRDLPGERVAVEGIARQRMHAKNELAAPGSSIGHCDRGLHAKFVAGAGLALGDAFNLGRVQRVDLVLVLGLLGAHLFGKFERLGEGLGDIGAVLAQCLDLATDIARQPPEPGSHLAQVAQCLLVAFAVDQPGHLAARFPAEPQERLAQLQPVFPREPADVLHRSQQQVRIGRMRHRLGLHRGVDRDPLAGLRAQRAAGHRHPQRFRDQQFKLVRADPPPPAGHRGAIEHQRQAKILLAAKILPIGIFLPPGAHLIIGQSVHVLEQMQPSHQPGWQPRAPLLLIVELAPGRIKARPVDRVRHLHQRVAHVDHVGQQHSEQFQFRQAWLLRRHRGAPSIRQLNHAATPCASPYVRARANSQAFPQNRSEPCDFGYFKYRFFKTRSACYEFFTGDDMVPWEASNNERILNAARWEIARSVAWGLGEEPPPKQNTTAILDYLQTKAPPVYDPFSGGGSIPLEAQRLGLRAYGSDLNPVAVLIGKALVEIPPKFAGKPPVNPKAQAELKRGGEWQAKGAEGLAEDVRYYGLWMRNEAEKRVGKLYPKAKLADGTEAKVIAWLWARTVRSPNPTANGAMVPLVSSFLLSTKKAVKTSTEIVFDIEAIDGWRFKVNSGELSPIEEARLREGTVGRKGAVCALTGAPIPLSYIRSEAKEQRLGVRLMAMVVESKKGRAYLAPDKDQENIAQNIPDINLDSLDVDIAENPRDIKTHTYGMNTFNALFSARQRHSLALYVELLGEVRDIIDDDAKRSFSENGSYADAITTYLGMAISRLADTQNALCQWSSGAGQTVHLFGRQAIPMAWDFAESSMFANAAGDLTTTIGSMCRVIAALPATGYGDVRQGDAISLENVPPGTIFATDPPYYDNICYADLADFFYVWLKSGLKSIWPELFRHVSTPKLNELIVKPNRHKNAHDAELFFGKNMTKVFQRISDTMHTDAPVTIYYAFKQTELAAEGSTSAGWASFLHGVIESGLLLDGTWPLRTERSFGLKGALNTLASSVVLVCRKRASDATTITRAEFIRQLKRELPDAIDDIRKAGVGPVDMQHSIIGPGMGVFSRHARVLEDDDSSMDVKTALAIINRVWGELENEGDAALDPETQVALAWFASYGFDTKPSGELITLANAKNISTSSLFKSDVFDDMSGRAGLKPRDKLSPDWTPNNDSSLTVWECVQHAARALGAEDGGDTAVARLIAQMGPKAADACTLAHRLFQIATDKGWAAEALVYNELAAEWPRLEALAEGIESTTSQSTAKPQLDLL